MARAALGSDAEHQKTVEEHEAPTRNEARPKKKKCACPGWWRPAPEEQGDGGQHRRHRRPALHVVPQRPEPRIHDHGKRIEVGGRASPVDQATGVTKPPLNVGAGPLCARARCIGH